MAIQRGEVAHDLIQLRESLNRVFEEALGGSAVDETTSDAAAWRPPLDLLDDGASYVVRADLPGVSRQDVEIDVGEERLAIRGERRSDRGGDRAYLRVERPVGRFAVEIALPASIDRQRIRARHRNGVLEIVLPKTERDRTPSRIPVDDG